MEQSQFGIDRPAQSFRSSGAALRPSATQVPAKPTAMVIVMDSKIVEIMAQGTNIHSARITQVITP